MSVEFVGGNLVRLLESGDAYFPALEAAIEQAQQEIYLETYIFADDVTGIRIAAALGRASRRGVAVKVLVDGFGSHEFLQTLGPTLMADGVDVLIYRPRISWLTLRRNRLRRLHRKLVVIDARIAFVGGINIIDDANTPNQIPPRIDFTVAVEGPVLAPIRKATSSLWRQVRWAASRQRVPLLPPPRYPERHGGVRAAFVIRDNFRHRRDIEDAYIDAISRAKKEIVMANAYFLPGRSLRLALIDAAARGVNVIVLLQGKVEYRLLHYATQSLYARLLRENVRIFEYHRSFLHAKVAVIDQSWATVGSSNIDPFSLLLAREANLVVRDLGFAQTLRASLQRAMDSGAREIGNDELARKSIANRTMSRIAYSLVRLAISLTRYGGQEYRE